MRLSEEDAVMMRAGCGRTAQGEHVLFELRVSVKEPTAAMLRQVLRCLTMQAEWFEEDERKAGPPATPKTEPLGVKSQ